MTSEELWKPGDGLTVFILKEHFITDYSPFAILFLSLSFLLWV
jgi:hypothetical protein